MSAGVRVAPITADDLDVLVELCREHAVYERAVFVEDGQVERWRDALFGPRPALHAWLATDGDEPAGFMTVTTDFATWSARRFAYMDCLFLREPYRGKGIGRRFFERLEEFARTQGCGWVEWQTPVDNELGIGFYERMGATSKVKARFSYEVEGREAEC